MKKSLDVHSLPCLIKEPGEVDVKKEFVDKTFNADTSTSHHEDTLGDFTLTDVCGESADTMDFSVNTLEYFARDVYSSDHGPDPLLGPEHLCNFLRGRCIRGKKLNLDALGHRLSLVEVAATSARDSKLLRNGAIPCKRVTEKEGVTSLTLWNQDKDIGPLDPNLAGYKHLLIASALSDYSGEKEFVERSE